MTKTVEEAIADLTSEIAALETEVRQKKTTVNALCSVLGRPPAYSLNEPTQTIPTAIRSDQFYGQPLAASVRIILEMRKAAKLGAATVNDIFEMLTAGGYQFETKSDDISRKSLRNSLWKNSGVFHKLPNGQFGLTAWYPNAKSPKNSPHKGANEADDTASSEGDNEDGG